MDLEVPILVKCEWPITACEQYAVVVLSASRKLLLMNASFPFEEDYMDFFFHCLILSVRCFSKPTDLSAVKFKCEIIA